MEKRGVSPLIATVLLVGFVIAIAILVWLWYGNVVKERADKEGARITGEFSCSSNVRISADVNDCDAVDSDPNKRVANFDLHNDGIADLNGIRILIEGNLGTETLGVSINLGTTSSQNVGELYEYNKVGTPRTLTVIPTVQQGPSTITCVDEKVILTC